MQSFRDALAQLGTIVKSWMRPRGSDDEPFAMTTRPNDHQRRVLEFLGVANRL